jgi:hypothetical protein
MRKIVTFLIIAFSLLNTSQLKASHIPGANITYTCNPANPLTYTFTLTIFRKCPGTHPATMTSTYFSMTNTCGLANPVMPTFNQVGVAQDVNQLCASATSNCSGGTDPGVWLYTYEATITLPADCDSWNIAFDLCCRDASSNLTGTVNNNMATNTTMNTATAPCNNSPVVTAQPIPYACTNTNFNYCLTIADPEGDSTYFQMVAPPGAGQAPIVHLPGYSIAAPLTGFVLDPLTGCFSFNEPLIGNYVVAIQINSYDNAGNLIASIIHDFQVMVISCTNTPPVNPVGGITNFSGTGSQVGPNTVSACFGDNVCFDVVFSDPVDPGNNLTITQDGTTLLPGATFTQTGTNPVTGTFCWLSQPGYTGSTVTFIAEDDGCPVMGTTGFAVNFNITTGVFAGPDQTICGAQGASLLGSGSGTYTWTPATGLSCTNCPNPTATPGSTTTYTVTGNLVGACANTDQVTVNVVPDFPLSLTPINSTICANDLVQFNAGGPGAQGPYTYTWSPSATLTNSTIGNPIANPLTNTTYTVNVTSAAGCTLQGTANIVVSGIGPTVTVLPSDTNICAGDPVQLGTSAVVYPLTCGVSAGCSGTTTTFDMGTATTSNTIYGGFYGSTTVGTDYTTKVQYIFTAAELNAMGYYGGTITAFSLYFTLTNAYQYDNVNVWMGCTTQDEYLTTSFIPTAALTQVAGPINNFNPVNNNWQNVNITDWDWDGISNLVIQICSEEDNGGAAGSNSVRYTSTSPAYRMVYDYSSTVTSCNEATGSRVTNRPNVRFTMCTQTVSSPTYSWSPSSGLSNSTISNPVASPTATTNYIVSVTNAGCTGSGVVNVNVSPNYSLNANASPISLCNGSSTTLSANPSIGGAFTYNWSPNGAFTNPNDPNPTVSPTGNTTYYITTSNGSCNKIDSVTVNVAGIPTVASTSQDTVCQGDVVTLDVQAGQTGGCGVNYSNCSGSTSTAVSATGTSASSTYGPFYGSTSTTLVYTNKKQFIFTATELTAMGFAAGTITELAMYVSTSTGRSYDNMYVYMGCTSQLQFLNTTFIPTGSLSQVYYNSKYTTSLGWNTFDITGYNWDGTSSIVIQFCSDNADQTGSESVRYTSSTPNYRCLYDNTSVATAPACAETLGTRSYSRPNMRFTFCNQSIAPGSTYSWTSPTGLSSTTVQSPTATITGDITYSVSVVDPSNPGCPSTANISVYIDTTNSVVASNDTTYCLGDPAFNLGAQFMTNGVPASAGLGLACYDQTITYANPALLNGTNNFNFAGTPAVATGGTLTINAYGDLDGAVAGTNEEMWTIQDENSNTIATAGGSNTQCGFLHTIVVPLTAVQLNAWSANGSIDFSGIDVAGNINATLCGVGTDLLELRLQMDCPTVGSGYTWSPSTGLNDSTLQNPTCTPTGPMTYVVTAIGGVCTVYDTVNVIICSILPVEMLSFTGENNGNVNELFWSTASELNNNYFTLERSMDGIYFMEIGTVNGAGNSTVINKYQFTDTHPSKGINYYRLKQTDFNGEFTYSEIIPIEMRGYNELSIHPNPSSNIITVSYFNNSLLNSDVTIYDVQGKIVLDNSIKLDIVNHEVDISFLNNGLYFIRVSSENNSFKGSFIKQ